MSFASVLEDIANEVHHRRFLKQLSRKEVAKNAGVSVGTLYNLEKCRSRHFDDMKQKRNITWYNIAKIIEALKIDITVKIGK